MQANAIRVEASKKTTERERRQKIAKTDARIKAALSKRYCLRRIKRNSTSVEYIYRAYY